MMIIEKRGGEASGSKERQMRLLAKEQLVDRSIY